MKTSLINWISPRHTLDATQTVQNVKIAIPNPNHLRRARLSCRASAFLAVALALFARIPAFAQGPYFWDGNDLAAGFGTAGGTWSAPTLGTLTYGWSADSTGATTVNGNSVTTATTDTFESFGTSSAGLGAGTVTVSGPVNSGPLVFDSASGAITLGGPGTITLPATAAITVNNAADTISANLAGAATSLTYNGLSSSILTLNGTNTFGPLTINGGCLSANATAIPSGAAVTVNTGAGGQLFLNTNTGSSFNNNFTIDGKGFAETPYGYGGNYDGALKLANGVTLTGTIALVSSAGPTYIGFLATAPGIYSETISGQITGVGPVQFYDQYGTTVGLKATNIVLLANTSTAKPNNYTGNTYIDNNYTAKAGSGGPDNTILELGANEQIPNGPNAGILEFDGWNPGNMNRSCTFELNGFNETVNGINTPTAGTSDNYIQNTSSGASTLTIGDADTTSTYVGTIRDGGTGRTLGITKIGAGTLTLDGVNTHLGPTIIKVGTLALGQSGSYHGTLPNSASITVSNGATFDVSVISPFALGSSQVLQGSGTVNGSVATPAAPGSIIFPGGAGVPGTLTFNNDLNLGSGGAAYFDVNHASHTTGNDQDVVNGALALSSLTAIHIEAGSTAPLDTTGDYVLFVGNGGTTMTTTPTLTFDSPVPSNYANYSLALSGNNVVLHHNATALPVVSSVTASPSILTNGQNTLVTAHVAAGTYPLASVSLDASAIGAGTVQLVSSNHTALYTNSMAVGLGVALGSAFLTATATDTQGNPALGSTYVTVVPPYFFYWDCNDVTLGFGTAGGTWSATTLGTTTNGWSIDPAGAITVNGNSVTTSTNDTSESFGTATSGLGTGTVTVSGLVNSGPLIFDAASGAITLGGSGTITLPATASITANNAADTISANLAGAVTNLTYNGSSSNVLTLSGTNTFGSLTINGGSLSADNTAIPSGVAVTVNSGSGGQLFLNTAYSASNNFTIDGKGYSETAYGGTYDGALRLANGATLTGTITLNTSSSTYIGFLATAAGMYGETLGGQITGTGPVQFYGVYGNTSGVLATNTVILANPNTAAPNNYTGNTYIDNNYTATAGYGGPDNTILKLGASEQIPNGPNAGILVFDGWNPNNINRSCTFDLNGYNETVNGISTPTAGISDNYILNSGSGASTLTVGDGDTTSSYGGTITDGGAGKTLALTKMGAGTLTLSGVNTYWGPTIIQAGTLALGVSATLPNTASLTVSNGATFDVSAQSSFILGNSQIWQGSGTVNGSVATPVSPGSIILPGGAGVVGTLAFNNDLDLSSGGLVYFDVNNGSYATGNDQITVGGTLTLASITAVHIVAGSTAALDTTGDYVLFAVNGATSIATPPALTFDSPVPSNSAHYSLALSGNNVVLHYNATALPVVSSFTANPSILTHGENTTITARVAAGAYPLASISLDASAIGGGTVQLVSSNGTALYTNTLTLGFGVGLGYAGLTVTATDTHGNQGVGSTYLTVVPALVTSMAPNPVTGSSYPVTLSLTGSGFTGATAVLLTNVTANTGASYAPTVNNDTSLSVTFVPGTAASTWNAAVVNGSPSAQVPFTVAAPTKASLNLANLNSAGAGALVLSGTGGAPGNSYAVESATNLTPPVAWVPVVTNVFGVSGNFSYTNTVSSGMPSWFLRLQQ